MTSPFPGMDPYLEGRKWPDLHHTLASIIRKLIAPQLPPGYFAEIDTYTVEDVEFHQDLGIMYPDVSIIQEPPSFFSEPAVAYGIPAVLTPPSFLIKAALKVKIPVVKIRDTADNRLVTAIEVLSPVNKRAPGLKSYLRKRKRLHENAVHFLEIDLLRRGERTWQHTSLKTTHYLVTLLRGNEEAAQAWSMTVRDKLPVVPVPLKLPDADVRLDLGNALKEAYDEGFYGKSVHYADEPPPPAFSEEDRLWMKNLLQENLPAA